MENLSGQGEQKKRLWTEEEDQKLRRYMEGIKEHERKRRGFWGQVPKLAGLNRSGKSCWLRWREHLARSGMKKGKFSIDEDNKVINLRANKFHGKNKWSDIAKELPGRTPNEVKNRWYNGLKKPLTPTQTPVVQTPNEIKNHCHNHLKELLTPTHTPVLQPLIAATGFPISGFGYINITPNPLEPHLRNGFPLPSQGPSSFNNLTIEDQLGPSCSILNNEQVYNNYAIDVGSSTASVPNTGSNHPVDVSSIPAEAITFNLWDISELHGLGFNSTGPAQVPDDSNYHVFDSSSTIPGQPGISREELITLEEKACLEFAEQHFMNDDDTYTDDLSDDKLDSWMKALGSCLNPL